MSSTMARASRNSLSDGGMRRLNKLRTPTAMAMSVAIGIPQPSLRPTCAIQAEVQRRGDDHPANRGDRGQRRGARVA